VDHPCEQCGSPVEDGRPFCPQCRGPQIHVPIVVTNPEAAPGLHTAPEGAFPEIAPPQTSLRPAVMDRRIAARAALLAGIVGVFLGIIPFLGIVLAGALAVFFYQRGGGLPLTPASGSRLGGAAGAVAFMISATMMIVRVFVFHAQREYEQAFARITQAFGVNPADPEIQDMLRRLFTPSGMVITLLFSLALAVAMAAIGGAVAAAILRPRPRT